LPVLEDFERGIGSTVICKYQSQKDHTVTHLFKSCSYVPFQAILLNEDSEDSEDSQNSEYCEDSEDSRQAGIHICSC